MNKLELTFMTSLRNLKVITKIANYRPAQEKPSPLYPPRQQHTKEPLEFTQSAFSSHVFLAHASTSANKINYNKIKERKAKKKTTKKPKVKGTENYVYKLVVRVTEQLKQMEWRKEPSQQQGKALAMAKSWWN